MQNRVNPKKDLIYFLILDNFIYLLFNIPQVERCRFLFPVKCAVIRVTGSTMVYIAVTGAVASSREAFGRKWPIRALVS